MKTIDCNKKKLFLLLYACFSLQVFGQWQMPQDYPGPNAAGLGMYGQIPVSGFTGTPDISIPLYTIQLKNFQLPIELRYHTGSVKPDVQPGWTGLGWTLTAGGSITRIIKGLRDETTKEDYGRDHTITPTNHAGYYYNSSILINASNWTDSIFVNNYTNSQNNFFNAIVDLEPDEFLYNFAGFSGSFFYNGKSGSKDQFKIKSQQPVDLNISLEVANNTSPREELEVFQHSNLSGFGAYEKRLPLQTYFSKFIIIDPNGIKYVFGGNKNAIDFTTTSANNNSITTAVTWYLTSITTPDGHTIQFEYKKEGDLFVGTRLQEKLYTLSNSGWCTGTSFNITKPYDAHLSILHLSYLKKITTSAGETIDFTSSASNELGYASGDIDDPNIIPNRASLLAQARLRANGNYKLKLDNVSISNTNTNEILKKFTFKYNNLISERLHLDTLKTDIYKYEFKYNTTKLPAYNAKKSDHWGFYNGKDYGNTTFNNLVQYRTPDINYMKAETLEEIIYPTGGSTKFEYEAHTYSKVSTLYTVVGNQFILQNENGTAGGLRIHKIISRPDRTSSMGEVVKEYFYTLPNNTSSGILSGKPVYETMMQQIFTETAPKPVPKRWGFGSLLGRLIDKCFNPGDELAGANVIVNYQSENFINPLGNTNGAHVTYSRIVEKMSDGSSSVYYYTNHEEQSDESPVFGITNASVQSCSTLPFSSKEAGRGLLKAEVHKNSQGATIDSTYYQYQYPYESFLKSISRTTYDTPCSVMEALVCYKQYACIPTLSTKTELRYDMTGKNPVTTITSYTYTDKKLTRSVSGTNSDGRIFKTEYKYPFDFSGVSALTQMTNNNIFSPIVEKNQYINSNLVQKEYTEYNVKGNTVYFPISFRVKVKNNAEEIRATYGDHDAYGNPRYVLKDNADPTVYLLGYKGLYPVAVIQNATYVQVRDALGGQTVVDRITNAGVLSAQDSTLINNLRSNANLKDAMITTYTYKPLIGMQSMTDPRGVVTSYNYDSFGRLREMIRAGRKEVLYDYHYKN